MVAAHPSKALSAALTARYAAADPAHAEDYRASAAAYVDQLEALVAWAHEAIDAVPVADRLLVTNHHGFSAFAAEFEVDVVGAIMPSFDDAAEPSAAEIDALVAAIRESGVRAVFSETTLPPGLAETIAAEAGVQVYTGDDALDADSLGAPGTDGATYLGSQVHNVTVIVESWGGRVPPLPDALR